MSLSTFASPGWLLLPAVIDNAASGSSAYAWDIEAAGTTGSAGYYFTWSGANGVRVHGTVSNALPDWIHNAGQGSFGYYSSLDD
jgi:hypothetical protein